jgi:hypothetical protein
MAESMRWDRKIGDVVVVGQTKKKNRNKNMEGFLAC